MADATITAGTASTSGAGQYGGFWIRVLAYLADAMIILLGLVVLGVPLYFLGGIGIAIHTVLWFVGPIAYFAWFTASERQATFGKQLCGLKVEHAGTGQRISLLRSIGRELAKFVSGAILMLGFLIVAFTPRKQGLHDFLGATVVVREGPARILLAVLIVLAGVIIPVIAVVIFGAMLMTLVMGGMLGGMLGGMGEDAMKQMKPVPQQSQPAPQPRPKPAAPQPTAPKAEPKPAPAPEPKAEAALPAKPEAAKPEPVAAAAPPKAAPKMAVEEADKPATIALPKPPAPVAVYVPPSPPGPAITPKYNDLMTAVLYRDAAGVAELLKLGKWVDKPDERGLTPLMAAAQIGDVRSAELLLKAGADPNRSAQGGVSARSIARERRDTAMTGLLQQHGLR